MMKTDGPSRMLGHCGNIEPEFVVIAVPDSALDSDRANHIIGALAS